MESLIERKVDEEKDDCPDPAAKKLLMKTMAEAYPDLDWLMLNTIVDYHMKNPDHTPEDIIAACPKDYFMTDTVKEEVGEGETLFGKSLPDVDHSSGTYSSTVSAGGSPDKRTESSGDSKLSDP